jgi:hypothetical protein
MSPIDRSLRLTDQEYRTCAKYGHGAHMTSIQDANECRCRKKHQALTDDAWHYLSCPYSISNEGTSRHNNIILYLKSCVLNGGCYARYEPRELVRDHHKHPDTELLRLPTSTIMMGGVQLSRC